MIVEQRETPTPGRKRKEAFIDRLAEHDWTTRETIIAAYDIAEVAHEGQYRGSGEPYFSHVFGTTLILMDECGVRNPDIIIGALLHDTVEDTPIFGDIYKLSSSKWLEIAQFRLGELFFNPKVAEIVTSLTKPKIDGIEIFNEDQRRNVAAEKLRDASPEALLVKMTDRLHNLRTLAGLDRVKAENVIAETQGNMFSVFSRILQTEYRQEGRLLLLEMTNAICDYERSQSR